MAESVKKMAFQLPASGNLTWEGAGTASQVRSGKTRFATRLRAIGDERS